MNDGIQAEEGWGREGFVHTGDSVLILFHLAFQRLCGNFGSRANVKPSKNILLRIDIPTTVGPEVS